MMGSRPSVETNETPRSSRPTALHSANLQRGFQQVDMLHANVPDVNETAPSERSYPGNSRSRPGQTKSTHHNSINQQSVSQNNRKTYVSQQPHDSNNYNQNYSQGQTTRNNQQRSSLSRSGQQQPNISNEQRQPEYSNSEEDLVLETFYHQSGEAYTCIYQSGQRFYLDNGPSMDWKPFPDSWFNQGVFVTDQSRGTPQQSGSDGSQDPQPSQQPQQQQQQASTQSDDRASSIDHPTRGRLSTYIFEEKRNVHYYFDRESGCWVRLPVSWELRSESVKRLLVPIEEAIPTWEDRHDMLASLRVCNYDPHDTIATYYTVNDDGGVISARNPKDAHLIEEKDAKIKQLTDELQAMQNKAQEAEVKLLRAREEKTSMEAQVETLEEKMSDLTVQVATATAHVEAVQRERPRTSHSMRGMPPPQLDAPIDSYFDVYQVVEQEEEEEGINVDTDTVLAIHNNTKLLHQQHVRLKLDTSQNLQALQAMLMQLRSSMKNISKFDSNTARELAEMKDLYQREALQRKLLYNKLQELRGNIRVFVRCRFDNRVPCCLEFPSSGEIKVPDGRKGFKFDRVYTPKSTQEEIFEDTNPIITSCVDGYNVCILAYGQTGSGKTFTMQGTHEHPGVNVRSIKELLTVCQERDNINYKLKASMVEIYNEAIQDLLNTSTPVMELRVHGNQVNIPGLTEMEVRELADIELILELGEQNRSVAATKMNSTSSRSHLVFMITVEGCDKASGATSRGVLTLCDLAGSERVSKSEAQGKRLVEAAAINKSLSALGQVFTALRTGQLHVPYRNSKLTHILQPSLSGDAKACLFVAVSPDVNNLSESISTLQFGSNARQVALGQAKKNVSSGPTGRP